MKTMLYPFKKIYSIWVLMIGSLGLSQAPIPTTIPTGTENYIFVIEPSSGNVVADSQSPGLHTIQYFDGLGRPKQTVLSKNTTSGVDMIIHYEYDGFGRQNKDYLPVRAGQTNGAYVTDPISKYDAFYDNVNSYDTDVYYSQKEIENSPLNRVMKQAAPGDAWDLGSGHEIEFEYKTNTTNEVWIYWMENEWSIKKGGYTGTKNYYDPGTLYKTTTTDENGNKIHEFKNKQGQVVLKRTYVANGSVAGKNTDPNTELLVAADTYYVYDIYGNLAGVVPPLASAGASITPTILENLCYIYKYDTRNRLIEKKLPGKGWEYMVYDKQDRLVATQDANLRTSSMWLFTKYDKFGRVVYTGMYNGGTSRASVQAAANAAANNNNETRETTVKFTTNTLGVYYTKTAFPTSFTEILSVNYYDNYSQVAFAPQSSGFTMPSEYRDGTSAATESTKGLPTVSLVRVWGTNQWEKTLTYYDLKSRPVVMLKGTYLGGYTETKSTLDFRGNPTQVDMAHKRSSASGEVEIKTVEKFTYDTQGRMLKHTHKVGSKPEELMAINTYDQLGQLLNKKVGGTDLTGAARLQQVDYEYNIRGWLTDINDVTIDLLADRTNPSANDDLFAFRIQYNSLDFNGGVTGSPADPLYNGNIAQTFWRTSVDNMLRGYSYEYDQINRLRNASFAKVTLGASSFPGAYDEHIAYDLNGNITSLIRNTGDATLNQVGMDDLAYTYLGSNATSNKLMKVTDGVSGSSTGGFTNGTSGTNNDYTYDNNGNMTADLNKGIASIFYNYLNLPEYIEFANGNAIEYLYNAAGQKLRKKVVDMGAGTEGMIKEVDYLDGFQYAGGVLQFFPTSEGYVSATASQSLLNPYIFNYVYNYTDHLGNIRLSYTKDPAASLNAPLEIMEENHYYPFGLKHGVYTGTIKQEYELVEEMEEMARPGYVYETEYQYKYNGKELQDELGLNMYDYGARNYDPALGRWMNMDLFSEKYFSYSPYNYVINNPLKFIDPTGMWIDVRDGGSSYRYKDGKLYSQNAETKKWDVEANVASDSYAGQILSSLNTIGCDDCTNGKALLDFFSNDKNDVNIFKSTKKVEGKNYDKTYASGRNIMTSFEEKDGRMTTGGLEKDTPFFLTLGHELGHVQSGYKYGKDVSSQTWYESQQANGTIKNVAKDEVYATDVENQLRKDHNLNLRTHYGIDSNGDGTEDSRVLENKNGQWQKTIRAIQILNEIRASKK